MSTILLAKELGANPVLLDDYRARELAKAEGLDILGSVGLLDPKNDITLPSLQRAAATVGRRVTIELV
ncbi:MAG: DUF3368 domain-containing protein, partial [Terriglobia bacterium]